MLCDDLYVLRSSLAIRLRFSNRFRRNGAARDGTQQRRALLLVPTDYVDQHTKRSTFLLPRGFHHEILLRDTQGLASAAIAMASWELRGFQKSRVLQTAEEPSPIEASTC